ncbi:aminotransferase class V-fold PLP-dependent enzyme [Acetivibrio ethanolgignens]|uniref:cysteine desulfurase n=1 Tax=Acetivibrio ethanolgignens TaxID=290052 RepID=A0A0V8QEA9_9FIRM|nr:aminotransferase class V-fold PLP-dependent enzyme [Acetivibrio ethanolgignens]KSV58393.1 cysteine desulfurase [Acetivibrio ethanolgignens]
MIYLDNAATTLKKPNAVISAVTEAMQSFGNSSRGTHESSLSASFTIFQTRKKLAELFGCPLPEQTVFTSNATEALNIAIHGILEAGDHVITTELEHNSVLRPLYLLEKELSLTVDFIPTDAKGYPVYEAIPSLIRPDTKAIICTHASNVTGNAVDISQVGKLAKNHGLLFLVDASQTAGHLPIYMEEMGIDILCFTGHKGLMGPQGTGGLCIREGLRLKPWKVGGSGVQSYSKPQPEAFPTCLEAGTLNGHGIAGLQAAVDFILSTGLSVIHEREEALMKRFYQGIQHLPNITVYGDFSKTRTPIVSLNIASLESGLVADLLCQEYEIAVRPGAHCAPRMHEALGTKAQGCVRFSFSYFNTEAEIDTAIFAVRKLSQRI